MATLLSSSSSINGLFKVNVDSATLTPQFCVFKPFRGPYAAV